jgi:phosphatidylserine decarboxylase
LTVLIMVAMVGFIAIGGFLFWRYVWFFRNPERKIPETECIVSPADGTVVYVKEIKSSADVIVIKRGIAATVKDIVREDVESPKLLIGIFMSPFNVHHNRAPLGGTIERITHHEPQRRNLHMGPMHMRTFFNLPPFYENSRHIVENERRVTRIRGSFKGEELRCYVVQIAGKTVSGIDSFRTEGAWVEKGEVFGMIRIGSQVDLVLPQRSPMRIKVRPGDKVYAGESILVE